MAAYLTESFNPEKQACELADPASRFLIVEEGGLTAGYARLALGPAPAAIRGRNPMEIGRFYARKPWIGKGVGTRLMQACRSYPCGLRCAVAGCLGAQFTGDSFLSQMGFCEGGDPRFQAGGRCATRSVDGTGRRGFD